MSIHYVDPDHPRTREVPSAIEVNQGVTSCGRWVKDVQYTTSPTLVDCRVCLKHMEFRRQ